MSDHRQQRRYRHWLRRQERDLDLPRWEFEVRDHDLRPRNHDTAQAVVACSLGIIAVGLGIFGAVLKFTGPASEPLPAWGLAAPPVTVKNEYREQADRFWTTNEHELGHLRGLDHAGRTR